MTTTTPDPVSDEPGEDATTNDLLRWVGRKMNGLTTVVVDERQGRRTTNRLAMIMVAAIIIGAFVVGGAVLYTLNQRADRADVRIEKLDKTAITCESRAKARDDARAGLVRLADELVKGNPKYPTAASRAAVHKRAVQIARVSYPALRC